MKRKIRKWALRLSVTFLFLFVLLLGIILNPLLTYAHKTTHGQYHIFHQQEFDEHIRTRLNEATGLLKKSELYNPSLRLDICLNDGAVYPKIIKKLRGRAFAWGFYDKVVLQGNTNYEQNFTDLDGYRWNFSQLLAHEAVHCQQYDRLGFRKSGPFSNIPEWKREGYPEYIARQNSDQTDLVRNINRLLETEKQDNNGWISFDDGTGTVIHYYKYWLLTQFCIDIKKMTYNNLLQDNKSEEEVAREMMEWHSRQPGK